MVKLFSNCHVGIELIEKKQLKFQISNPFISHIVIFLSLQIK